MTHTQEEKDEQRQQTNDCSKQMSAQYLENLSSHSRDDLESKVACCFDRHSFKLSADCDQISHKDCQHVEHYSQSISNHKEQDELRYRMKIVNMSSIIRKVCQIIMNKMNSIVNWSRISHETFEEIRHQSVKKQLFDTRRFSTFLVSTSWLNSTRLFFEVIFFHRKRKRKWAIFTSSA
jgi:hypothetical protein